MKTLFSVLSSALTPSNLEDLTNDPRHRSFYTLSKTHHPDLNPSDPTAAQRFHRLSTAYHVLATPESRQTYDRETFQHTSHQAHRSHPSGSYHSTNPAGGRSPSGLSRRRSQFHGPPASFYRSGGWGAHSAKRKEAHENPSHAHAYADSATGAGGMGPGQDPMGHSNDVPHFDREGHFRTGENQRRRRERLGGSGASGWSTIDSDADVPPSLFTSFWSVGLIMAVGIGIPVWLIERRMHRGWSKGKAEE